jgi:hypothetical protein
LQCLMAWHGKAMVSMALAEVAVNAVNLCWLKISGFLLGCFGSQ